MERSIKADREVVMAAVEQCSGVDVEWGSGVAECRSVVGSEAKWSCRDGVAECANTGHYVSDVILLS